MSVHEEEQHPSEGKVKTGRVTFHIEEQEAATLPGCPISSELPTITSPTTTQIQRVLCPTNTMPGIPNIFLLFQMMPSAHPNNEDNDNESKIKILKMIG